MEHLLVYLIGLVTSIVFLHHFKKWFNIDYPNGYYDDWQSNSSAIVGFSLFWFVYYPLHFIRFIYIELIKFSNCVKSTIK